MNQDRTRPRLVGLSLAICFLGAELHGQEPGGIDDSERTFRQSFAAATGAIAPLLDRYSQQGEILVSVTKAAQSLDRQAPDPKLLQDALAAMRDAERLAVSSEASRELQKSLSLAVDRLRTELLNPGFTDMRRLSDDLHHSAVHPASAENRRNTGLMRELFDSMLGMQNGLGGLAYQLTATRPFPTGRPPSFAMRPVDPSHDIQRAFANYSREVSRLAARIARNREISTLIYGAMHDLDTFQNAIGLSKSREKLKEAEGKFVHGDADPELRKPVVYALQRLEIALLSPSSTDMDALLEELHHLLIHPAELVRLNEFLETHRHLSVILEESQRAGRTAAELGNAVAAASAREIPAVRQRYGLSP